MNAPEGVPEPPLESQDSGIDSGDRFVAVAEGPQADGSEDETVQYDRQIGSFSQYARHQLSMATKGLSDPGDIATIRAAVLGGLSDMVIEAGADPADFLSELAEPRAS